MTQTFRIEVNSRQHTGDHNKWVFTAHQLGFSSLTGCVHARVFFVSGDLTPDDADRIGRELLADPITETFTVTPTTPDSDHFIDVTLQPGVTDPIAENLVRVAHLIGLHGVKRTASGSRYYLYGDLSADDLHNLAEKVFANIVIHRYTIDSPISAPFIEAAASDGLVETIEIIGKSDDDLLNISKERRLSLDLNEMRAIQAYYTEENRQPTDIELETLAQTWSEHCVHKTFRAKINFTDETGTTEQIDGILNTYLRKATEAINKPWVRSAFVDNAGIIAFDDYHDIAFKVETHNHPSALEPFGGANTGVGGVVRDVLGVSAKPIANTDILMFGPQDLPEDQLPEGVLHPRRIADGVIHGVEDYGNKMGIPTVNGAIVYDRGYTANPLVFCGCLGILPTGTHRNTAQDGDLIVVLGGRTGRDGLRGATFSSMEMDTSTSEIASISVQIGHPINEKQVQEVVLRARDESLYTSITDCGAGGLSSAVGEMGEKLGATVELTTVPLKYAGLRPWEIWLSEAQERMVMAVPEKHWDRLQAIADSQNVEVAAIGSYEATGKLRLLYEDKCVGELGMHFLHDGIPQRQLDAHWQPVAIAETTINTAGDHASSLLALLAHPNIRSKEDTVRRYDHEVQGGTVVKPFVGVDNDGPGNASVIIPIETKHQPQNDTIKGAVLSVGLCPEIGKYDPYAMAWAAIDEALRNAVAIGADPDRIAILDNFCWGNPNLPDRLGSLVLTAKGCHDAAMAYQTPFISGKDSLNNEYADENGQRHAIPGTLVISAVGIVPDVQRTCTMDLKQAGNQIVVIGATRDERRGSHYNMIHGVDAGTVPQPPTDSLTTFRQLHQAIQQGLIRACHDISEGGLVTALAEMSLAGQLGVTVSQDALAQVHSDTAAALFSESAGRFIVEVTPDNLNALSTLLGDVPHVAIGTVTANNQFSVGDIHVTIDALRQAWRGHVITEGSELSSDGTTDAVALSTKYQTVQMHKVSSRVGPARVLILHANGTNRDHDAALAVELAGGIPEIVHINQLTGGDRNLLDYHMLIVPGGFSYGDDLGAGQLWAQDLRYSLRQQLEKFVVDGRPVLGICNGFQVLMKSGLLPHADFATGDERTTTLTHNQRNQFECRWVHLQPNPASVSLFTQGLSDDIYCPVAHGEGRVIVRDQATLDKLWRSGQIALTYTDPNSDAVHYPANPNGSVDNIAAITNGMGNVMGLMPHPENHIFPWQHPRWHRGESGQLGLVLFKNGIKFA